ncbi:hypothetical protein DN536_40390, partial [Burkholderia multivorans]
DRVLTLGLEAQTCIAHTRWATHGAPSEKNAHPIVSRDTIAVVHNGIIENHDTLRAELRQRGYEFRGETDTEVIAHLVRQPRNVRSMRRRPSRSTAIPH